MEKIIYVGQSELLHLYGEWVKAQKMSLHLMDARYCIRVSIASVIALFNCLIKCSKQNTYNWEVELWPKVCDLPLPERSFFRVLLLLFTIKGVTWSVGETNLWYARVRLVGLVGCHSVYTHIARFGCLTFQNTNMSKSFSHFWYSLIAWVLNFENKVCSFPHLFIWNLFQWKRKCQDLS